MEIDLIKIKNQANNKEDENWQFRTFLKNLDKDLDPIVHKLLDKVSKEVDCTVCGNCCKESQTNLTNKDINRLAKGLNIKPDKLISEYVEKNKEGNYVITQIPCPFLNDNKCTQYNSRPTDCESYPHLNKNDFVSRLIGVICNYSICPIVFNVYESLKKEFKSEFIKFQNEFDAMG